MNPVEEDRALAGEYEPLHSAHREAADPAMRHLTWIAGLIGAFLILLLGGWMLFGPHDRQVPVIEADPGPVRVKPDNPGGMQPLGEQEPLFATSSGPQTLAPPPEQARPEALQAQLDAARRRELLQSAPVASSLPETAPIAPPAPLGGHKLAPPAEKEPSSTPPINQQLHTDIAPAPSPALPAAVVQLAALGSHSAAKLEWAKLIRLHPSLFQGRSPVVEQVDHAGHRIYRLRTAGFASLTEAHSFCTQARAQGVPCMIADF